MAATGQGEKVGNGEWSFPAGSLMSQVDILRERNGVFDAMVPFELIDNEEVPVEQKNVDNLTNLMIDKARQDGGTGQITPIYLGEVAGLTLFPIIDGFHREASLGARRKGEPHITHILSSIRVNMTMADVLDERIIMARDHRSLSFARVSEWINALWKTHSSARLMSVTDAFSLTNGTSTGVRGRVPADELADIATWVSDKCALWQMTATEVHKIVSLSKIADPDLVKTVRSHSGREARYDLNPTKLGVIARGFPNSPSAQHSVARVITAAGLTNDEAMAAVRELKRQAPKASDDELAAALNSIDWSTIKGRSSIRPKSESAPGEDPGIARELLVTEIDLALAAFQIHVLRGTYISPGSDMYSKPGIIINYGDDAALKQIATPGQPQISAFNRYVNSAEQQLIEILVTRHETSSWEARTIMATVKARVLADLRKGDLRHMRDINNPTFRNLTANILTDELASRKAKRDAVLPYKSAPPEPRPTRVLYLADVLPKLPGNDRLRKAIVYRGFLDLSMKMTSILLGLGPAITRAENLVDRAYEEFSS